MQYKIITKENTDKLANYIKSKGYKVTKNVFSYYVELSTNLRPSGITEVSKLESDIGRGVYILNKEIHVAEPNFPLHRFS